ncbi:MAG: alpha/beta fold hydrolase [Myxococcota bacterium]|nr:alpha/beta fold hydrolase [Myxococcota bacterium]
MKVAANGIELEVECLGDESAPPVVLVNGLGGQLVRWGDGFCTRLAEQGLRVFRYDQRDVGFSTKFDRFPIDRVRAAIGLAFRGESPEVPYGLEDMAGDLAALIHALGLGRAHVAGISLGGMVGQLAAIHHPERLTSLTSIMSTTGDRSLPPPTPAAAEVLMTQKPGDRAGYIDHEVASTRIFHGSGLPFDEAWIRERAAREFDRAYTPDGSARHLLASAVQASRREPLRGVRVPTLVVHGDADPLVRLECGLDTHASVPGSKLHVVRGMGHDLCPAAWDEIAAAIGAHARASG